MSDSSTPLPRVRGRGVGKKNERAKHATLGKTQSPVAIQLRQALALFCVPEDDLHVIAAARENPAVERPGDCVDTIAAIF
jgi:hypothetical protein